MADRLKLFLPLIIFLLIAGVFLNLQNQRQTGDYDPSSLPSALIGKELPEFQLSSLKDPNQLIDRQQILGKPFILNVWATWCVSCRVEHAYLNELSDTGIRIIGLNYKDERDEAKRWLTRLGDPYELNLFDSDGNYGLEIGVYGAPESYIIDTDGTVLYRHVGVLNQKVWERFIIPLGLAW